MILAVCAVLSAVGFWKFVYFLSIGYGFAIAGGGITVLILVLYNGWAPGMLWLAVLQAALFVVYGARLSGFLLVREIRNASYRKTLSPGTVAFAAKSGASGDPPLTTIDARRHAQLFDPIRLPSVEWEASSQRDEFSPKTGLHHGG